MNTTKHFFANEKASASAGSGKTFSLTTRFIALACAKGKDNKFDPFSIIALTFTKKAAGEFLVNIIKRLANAVLSENDAQALSKEVIEVIPTLANDLPTQESFAKILKLCVKDINKLHLSTIDSFFSTIVRQNANALKIFAPITIEDENGAKTQHFMLESISHMMNNNAINEDEVKIFAELVKRASFKEEKKQFCDLIKQILQSAHHTYFRYKDEDVWGNIELSNVKFNNIPYNQAIYTRNQAIVESTLSGIDPFKCLLEFIDNPTRANLKTNTNAILDNILQHKLNGTLATLTSIGYKKSTLPLTCAKEIDLILDMIFTEHFTRLSDASKAMWKIASLYEKEYENNIRSKGNITFSDIPFILSDDERQTEKEIIEYKLDSKFNHWLFDEFQDTSYTQWNILKNLVEEAILSSEKSFYYVGDVKQSIYSWRGASPELFNGIFNYYNQNTQLISNAKPLTVSWRSGEYVIDAVNKIFEDEKMLKRVFGEQPAKIFSHDFQKHISAESLNKKKQYPSYARLTFYDGESSKIEETYNICEKILEILQETNPIQNGTTCAILVNKNEQANYIVDFLKENGYNASGELAVEIASDRPIVSLFTAILRRLAHPQNTASDAYCNMADISDFTCNFSEDFVKNSILKIYTEGFKSFATDYEIFMRNKFKTKETPIEYAWLTSICNDIDKSGVYSIDEAVEYINSSKINTSASKSVIQVMTIHKSKGLAFGMVILPISIENKHRDGMIRIGDSIMIAPSATLASMNKDLQCEIEKLKDINKFENICKQYVAMTRPERALYILAKKFKDDSFKKDKENDISFERLLLEAFYPAIKNYSAPKDAKGMYADILNSGGVLDMGNANWFKDLPPTQPTQQQRVPEIAVNVSPVEEFETYAPSSANKTINQDKQQALLGIKIHDFLEQITSIKNVDLTKVQNVFEEYPDVVKGLSALFINPQFTQFFDNENAFEKNEIPFSRIENNKQIVGTIDRLVAIKNTSGFEKAFVIDYKPNTNDIEKYKSQLIQYKNAVADILNLDQEKISCYIAGYLDGKVVKL